MNILTKLGETEINICLISENSNDINNIELGGSITIDEPSINRAALTDEGRINGFFVLRLFLISVTKLLQKSK